MHLNRFDLNLLIALDALLREKNVTRAGERVYLSQSAMSGACSACETTSATTSSCARDGNSNSRHVRRH